MRIHDIALASHGRDFVPSDPSWPACLDELSEPPARLRYAGTLPFLDRAVAIVGTRRATPDALELARVLARDLSRAGCVIVSGGAEGIDAAAHEGALEGGGLGVAVLAGGLARPYPRAHAPLFARIAENGAIVSEAGDDDAPPPHAFLARNRLIAALARAVVVVQAPFRSGALSTAAHAKALGRPLFAVPWAPADPRGEGCLALLARGEARVLRGASDLLRAMGDEPPRRAGGRRGRESEAATQGLDDEQRTILDAIGSRAAHVDDLVRATGLAAARVQTTLTTLMLLGIAISDDRGAFRRVR